MGKKIALTGNHAVAYAVKLAKPQVIAAYPITPQSPIVEKLSEMIEQGELKARMIRVESEHSALAACFGAAVAGARTLQLRVARDYYTCMNSCTGRREQEHQ